jgi:hypothetical protein
MPDLIVYIPSHGYSNSDYITVSWLGGEYYVRDKDTDTFKISSTDDDLNLVQFTETITDGYVREQSETGSATISGLDHLEGETVFVTSNGERIGSSYIVSGGSITLSDAITTYQVGLPYSMKIRTMRLEVPSSPTVQTRVKKINETVVRHVRAREGRAGQEKDGTEYLNDVEATFATQSADSTIVTRGGMSEDSYTVVKSDNPYPFTVLATIISFTVEENR